MVSQNSYSGKSYAIFNVDDDYCSQQVRLRTEELEKTIYELKSTQQQKVQQEKMAMIGQLAAGIAHEINNPIGFVSSNLFSLGKYFERLLMFIGVQQETLLSRKDDLHQTEQVQTFRDQLKIERIIRDIPEMIRETFEGVERVKKIVMDLKRFTLVDDSEQKLADINQCLENILDIACDEIACKATVKREYGELPQILCYEQQLNLVFMNLMANAVHATKIQGEITVRSWNAHGQIFVSFSDTGCGIPEHQLSRIFEPFFTTKEAGRGTGLGLSISNEIVRNHGGEIRVDSEVGQGSTFTVSISLDRGATTFYNHESICESALNHGIKHLQPDMNNHAKETMCRMVPNVSSGTPTLSSDAQR
jgi:two-component system, NtrC family, sensor kinase